MRFVACSAFFAFIIACGPPPEDSVYYNSNGGNPAPSLGGTVPGTGGTTASAGGTASQGGVISQGGTTAAGGSGGFVNPFGGQTPGMGGAKGGTTFVFPTAGAGGTVIIITGTSIAGGAGGSVPNKPAGLALTTYTFGGTPEPCLPTKDVSGGQTGNIGLAAACLRTADDFSGWNCSSMDDRTVKINGIETKCGVSPPPKYGDFYYFDISAGSKEWASFSWFCTVQNCGPHPIPACGHYPPWQATGPAAPCADAPAGSPDAGVAEPDATSPTSPNPTSPPADAG